MVETFNDKAQEKQQVAATGSDQENQALINMVQKEIMGNQSKTGALLTADVPDSKLGRYGLATAKGIANLPEGIVNSVVHNVKNPGDAAMTLAMGAGTAFVLKTVLPESGAAGKIAAAGIGLYFTYKAAEPIMDGYSKAGNAKSMAELDVAAKQIGNAGGEFLVNGAIAYGGYRLGAYGTDKMLATTRGQQFVAAREGFYDNLTQQAMKIPQRLGLVEAPPPANVRPSGAIPRYMLDEIAERTTSEAMKGEIAKTKQFMAELERKPGNTAQPRNPGQDKLGVNEVYDAKGREIEGTLARTDGQKPTGIQAVDDGFEFTSQIRDFYKQVHGRQSIDGQGMPYRSTVNYGTNYENAFWNGERMTYGSPGKDSPFKTFMLLDVAAHEVTHGITEHQGGAIYRNQAGALNESFSDVWGSLVKQWTRKQTADKADWLVGEGIWKENINGRALRDMKNPGKAYNDPAIGKDPQPGHMKDYNHTRGDNGGVHYNSGIPNRAFAEFAIDVGGHAWERPGQIWWAARKASGSNPNFATFAHQTLEQAKLLGHTDLIPKLQKAWDTVGVKPSAKAVDVPAPPMPTTPDGGNGDGVPGRLPPTAPEPGGHNHIRKAG